jgi:hypothetical protein
MGRIAETAVGHTEAKRSRTGVTRTTGSIGERRLEIGDIEWSDDITIATVTVIAG